MSSGIRLSAAASMEFVKCLGHPEEFYNLLRFQMGGRRKVIPEMDQDSLSSSLKTCYKYLNQTSRSFAAVIQALDGEMRSPWSFEIWLRNIKQ